MNQYLVIYLPFKQVMLIGVGSTYYLTPRLMVFGFLFIMNQYLPSIQTSHVDRCRFNILFETKVDGFRFPIHNSIGTYIYIYGILIFYLLVPDDCFIHLNTQPYLNM